MNKNRRYRIKTPTIAIWSSDGCRKTVTVPADATVTISESLRDGDRLIDVVWNDENFLMFTQDLRERGEELPQ
jgi:hypothetical protein